ncbi:MAG: tetratricopeptide repeat protein [Acidobacteriota bacterium]
MNELNHEEPSMTEDVDASAPEGNSSLPWWPPVVLALVLALAYWGSLGGAFVLDDIPALVENTSIRSFGNSLSPPDNSPLAGRPLSSLSFAVTYALGELDPAVHRGFNLLLHWLAALLLFDLLRRALGRRPLAQRFAAGTGTLLALAVALLWAAHPLVSEAVLYIVQRTELLVSVFLLLTLYGLERAYGATSLLARGEAAESSATQPGTSKLGGWALVAVVACFAGMASKEVMVVAPLLVWTYDRLLLSGSWRRALSLRPAFYGLLASSWALLAVLVLGSSRDRSVSFSYAELTPVDYLLTQAGVILHYLRLAIWPSPLVVDYDDWPIAAGIGSVALPLLVIVALLAITLWGLRRGRPVAFLGALFFLVLAPSSSLLPIATEVAAERRMYLPLAALVILVVLGGWAWLSRLAGVSSSRSLMGVAAATLTLALVASVWTVRERGEDFVSAETLYAKTLEARPDNSRAHNNLGVALLENPEGEGGEQATARLNRAVGHFATSLQLAENDSAYTNLGIALMRRGQLDLAIDNLRNALRLAPESAKSHLALGNALSTQGELEEAQDHYRQALELEPERAEIYNSLAALKWRQGERELALSNFRQALEKDPAYKEAAFNLGVALLESGRPEEALEPLSLAVTLDPLDARAHSRLGFAFARQGQLLEAAARFREAVKLDPENADAHNNLGKALASLGRLEEAMEQYEAAVALRPGWPQLLTSLAWTFSTHPDDGLRDGAKAVTYGEQAVALTNGLEPIALDAYAAALAESGRFDEAVATAQRAVQLAREAGVEPLAVEFESRLALYRSGQPMRQAVEAASAEGASGP